MTLLDGKDVVTTRLSRSPGSVPAKVTLSPGASASFGFSHRAYRIGGHCDDITAARVYDPDGSGYRATHTAFTECEGITARGLKAVPIQVGPFRTGTHATLA